VVGRYSVLPFYKELEEDLRDAGSTLINSHREHRFVADLQNYVGILDELTPKTWTQLSDVPDSGGPFVVKGETNSRKDKWSTHCFARNKTEAIEVAQVLMADGLIGQQQIYVRQFVELETFLVDPINKQPITREFRFFFLRGKPLVGGYYWSNYLEDLNAVGIDPKASEVPQEFLLQVGNRVKDHVTFVVVDVAKTMDGRWIVIELNDGQMSGLSCIPPEDLYRAMALNLTEEK